MRVADDQPVHASGQHGVRLAALFLGLISRVHNKRGIAELRRGFVDALVHNRQNEVRKPGNYHAHEMRATRPQAGGLRVGGVAALPRELAHAFGGSYRGCPARHFGARVQDPGYGRGVDSELAREILQRDGAAIGRALFHSVPCLSSKGRHHQECLIMPGSLVQALLTCPTSHSIVNQTAYPIDWVDGIPGAGGEVFTPLKLPGASAGNMAGITFN
ncbi:hypothetical protein SRABI128_06054 [Microbacterium sp. Bi128]|nr:hypothetical protein SRABI128_06054 [Microbacterium sp. Bi128]